MLASYIILMSEFPPLVETCEMCHVAALCDIVTLLCTCASIVPGTGCLEQVVLLDRNRNIIMYLLSADRCWLAGSALKLAG